MTQRKNKAKKGKIKNKKNSIMTNVLIILALVCLIIVTIISYNTYSMWIDSFIQTDSNKVTTGCFELIINDLDENGNSTAINLQNAYPISNDKGLKTKPYNLSIKNVCSVPSDYTVILSTLSNSNLDPKFLRYQILQNNIISDETSLLNSALHYELDEITKNNIESSNSLSVLNSYNLISGTLNQNESINYDLRVWLDYEATNEAMDSRFEAVVTVLSTSPH